MRTEDGKELYLGYFPTDVNAGPKFPIIAGSKFPSLKANPPFLLVS